MNINYKIIYKKLHIYKNRHISYRCYKKLMNSAYGYIDTDNINVILGRMSGKKAFLESLGYKVISLKEHLNRIYGDNNG